MKKILVLLLFVLCTGCSFASVSELFVGTDSNALKAGIAKYILTKGGKVSHGEAYESNTMQAMEVVRRGYSNVVYNYVFNFKEESEGTRLTMQLFTSEAGSKPEPASLELEQQMLERIKNSTKSRFLYGLGFDFATYRTPNGTQIKAPKGKNSGIVLTAVRYDAQKQGLQAGDVIVEINGVKLKDIPLTEYATALVAKTITDKLTLTYKRKGQLSTVTLTPRLSNIKTF